MRLKIFIALGLLAVTTAWADENFPLLKTGSEVYSNVTVLTVTTTDVYFTYNNNKGMANAKLKNLSPDLQKHFHYNAAKAGAVEQKQAADNAQYHLQVIGQPDARPPDESRQQPAAAQNSGSSWGTDLPSALNQARSDNKMVLLDFTGSDWCGWCMKFDHDVLSTDKFENYAKNKLVLVQLDFPHDKPQSAELKKSNQGLQQKYGVDGFPTFVLLNPDGKELGRQVGYLEGGSDAFIAELENFSKR